MHCCLDTFGRVRVGAQLAAPAGIPRKLASACTHLLEKLLWESYRSCRLESSGCQLLCASGRRWAYPRVLPATRTSITLVTGLLAAHLTLVYEMMHLLLLQLALPVVGARLRGWCIGLPVAQAIDVPAA